MAKAKKSNVKSRVFHKKRAAAKIAAVRKEYAPSFAKGRGRDLSSAFFAKVSKGGMLRIKNVAGKTFVVMTEHEYESWQETHHLLRSPANARRLLSSIADADAGKLFEHELIEG